MGCSEKTDFSIVIPVYNDPSGIKKILNHLVNQSYPEESYEIIVVDNNSNKDTKKIINKFESSYPKTIKKFNEKIQSSYAARNKGIKKSKNDVIIFLDSDIVIEQDFLEKINQKMLVDNIRYATCNVEMFGEETLIAKYNLETDLRPQDYIKNDNFAPTCCLITKKEIFEKYGYFDSRLISGGDFEFGDRVYSFGVKQHYFPEITIKHPTRKNLKNFIKKYLRIGKGFYQLNKYYPERFKKRNNINRSTIDLKYILPTPPLKILKIINEEWVNAAVEKRSRNWDKLRITQKISFFILEWLRKMTVHLGFLYQKIKDHKK